MAKDINIEEEEINEDVSETNETNEMNEASETSDTSENSDTSSSSEPSDSSEPELSPLEKAEKEIEQLKDQYLRARAEFENYRKRTIKEKAELILNGGEKTITAILPVLDDFERALADTTEDPEAIKQGMELIFHKFVKTLEGLGVKKIETEEKPFDVDYHEAIAMVPGMGDDKKGMVIDCVQTGYMLNDKVIRHAKVAVGQ
ncbi:MAG: nucleotide exchange factor GrpE [Prevotella sp.]|nr:nucleotide exchange factor GrpE [Prevotella sp.]MBP5355978.1 nucleotide exchange factor GrpE [Prevotella sp.]